uniref:Uncharacterized protein n=1 Tax=Romanomermis culicivorax TaxID=13658 RepID=A0A915HWN3_ROMCU
MDKKKNKLQPIDPVSSGSTSKTGGNPLFSSKNCSNWKLKSELINFSGLKSASGFPDGRHFSVLSSFSFSIKEFNRFNRRSTSSLSNKSDVWSFILFFNALINRLCSDSISDFDRFLSISTLLTLKTSE